MYRIVFLGAGNVATHLAPALEHSGVGKVAQVWSRTLESAKRLCDRLENATPITNIDEMIPDADIYIVSLVDHAVNTLISHLPTNNALWVHTSGSVDMGVFSQLTTRYGVLYPLQTFSREVDVDMAKVPIFIEGSTEAVAKQLHEIASQLSQTVYYADGTLRARMHIAAVFACNFSNYMFTVADDLLHRDNLDLSVLYPLLEETIRKALKGSPAAGQTGPAVRGDRDIVERHASALPPDLSQLYLTLSDAIYRRHH